jgi:cytochrome P450
MDDTTVIRTSESETIDDELVRFMNDPSLRQEPHKFLSRLRAADPVHFSPVLGMWFISDFEGCTSLTRDRRWSVAMQNSSQAPDVSQWGIARRLQQTMILFRDDPSHARLRKVISPLLSPAASEEWRQRYRAVADERLAQAATQSTVEAHEDIGLPLALWVLVELLGLPQDAGPKLVAWAFDFRQMFEPSCTAQEEARADEVIEEMRAYLEPMLEQRRRGSGFNDIIAAFAKAEDDGLLKGDDAIAYTLMLSQSAFDTSANLISLAILQLLSHPDQWDQIVADPSKIKNAVEEVMRFSNSVWIVMPRYALEDIEIAGKTIKKGDKALAILPAADRDPEKYSCPDDFNINRADAKYQLGFGDGAHVCSGQWLARVEVQEVVASLAKNYPRSSLVPGQTIIYGPQFGGRHPQSIEVLLRSAE